MDKLTTIDLSSELQIALRLLVALVLGALIGLDRERHGSSAGIRTYAAVCLGAALFTAVGEHMGDIASASRIIANILVGIGFIGAGIIYKNERSNSSQGLTTAATIWCTAAIGVTVALKMYIVALFSAFGVYFLLALHHHRWYISWKRKLKENEKHQDKSPD